MSSSLIMRKAGKEGQECMFLLPTTLALGDYHDILMAEKAWCIDRMVANQKAEQETADKMKEITEQQERDESSPCSPCLPCGEEVSV